jgi:hypothetical protein
MSLAAIKNRRMEAARSEAEGCAPKKLGFRAILRLPFIFFFASLDRLALHFHGSSAPPHTSGFMWSIT